MAQVVGITLERTATGRPKYVRFDFKEYGAVLYKFLLSEGIDCSSLFTPNETTKIAISEIKEGKSKTFKKSDDLFKDLGI